MDGGVNGIVAGGSVMAYNRQIVDLSQVPAGAWMSQAVWIEEGLCAGNGGCGSVRGLLWRAAQGVWIACGGSECVWVDSEMHRDGRGERHMRVCMMVRRH